MKMRYWTLVASLAVLTPLAARAQDAGTTGAVEIKPGPEVSAEARLRTLEARVRTLEAENQALRERLRNQGNRVRRPAEARSGTGMTPQQREQLKAQMQAMRKTIRESVEKIRPQIQAQMESLRPQIEAQMKALRPLMEKAAQSGQTEALTELQALQPEIERSVREGMAEAMKGLADAMKELDHAEATPEPN